MAGSHEVPKIRVAVSPNMDVIGLSGEKLQSFYTPDPNINLEKIYDPRTYPTLRAFNAALEKEGAEGRIRTMTEGKVFEITHDPERTDEEALAYTHTMLGVEVKLFANPVYERVTDVAIISKPTLPQDTIDTL